MKRSGTDPDGLTPEGYQQLRQAAQTHRDDLVLRLGAEVGVRPGEMTEVRPADVTTVARDGRDHYLLAVGDREAYLPRGVERDLRQYANANDVAPREELFDVSARRLQMLVREVTEAAGFEGVSSADLRAYFAGQSLSGGVNPAALLAAGGWSHLESLSEFLPAPDRETVVASFADANTDGDGTVPAGAVAAVAAAADAVDEADSEQGVREAAATALSDADSYRDAWVRPPDGDPVGGSGNYATAIQESLVDRDPTPHASARATGDVQTTADAGSGVVAVVPVPRRVARDETLVVVAEAVDDAQRRLLSTLGSAVGSALTTTRQRRRLVSDTVTRVTFGYEGGVLPPLSADLSCSLALAGAILEAGTLLLFLDAEGVSPETVLDIASRTAGLVDVRLVSDYGDSARFEVILDEASPLPALVGTGATLASLSVADGTADATVDVSPEADIRALRESVRPAVSEIELKSKQEVERPDTTVDSVRERLTERLTDRQTSTLRAAYLAGYFEWPRESTAESLADSLDVSSPTLHQHLRKAQQKLLDTYFESSP